MKDWSNVAFPSPICYLLTILALFLSRAGRGQTVGNPWCSSSATLPMSWAGTDYTQEGSGTSMETASIDNRPWTKVTMHCEQRAQPYIHNWRWCTQSHGLYWNWWQNDRAYREKEGKGQAEEGHLTELSRQLTETPAGFSVSYLLSTSKVRTRKFPHVENQKIRKRVASHCRLLILEDGITTLLVWLFYN